MEINLYADLGTRDIAGGAGRDVRDEPEFESLQAEIGKLSSPTASGTVDWAQVEALAKALLADKGKDMLVAAYLAGAALQQRGLSGLADGLGVLADMVPRYWETLFPPLQRLRGRRNSLLWLIDRIQVHAAEHDWSGGPPQVPELVARLEGSLKVLDGFLGEKDEEGPSLRPVLTLLRGIPLLSVPDEVPQTVASTVTPTVVPATTSDGTAATPAPIAPVQPVTAAFSVAPGDDVEQALEQMCRRSGEIADVLLQANLADARAYRLKRQAVWGSLDNPPPAQGGATRIPSPPEQVITVCDRLLASQSDEGLVQFAEGQLTVSPFWLDLNRICCQALERMGAAYAAATAEVSGETARLLARFPGLEVLTFADGRPFADAETRAWLGSLASAGEGERIAPDPLAGGLAQARRWVAEGDPAAAAAVLQEILQTSVTPLQRLRVHIQLCQLLLTSRLVANLPSFAQVIVDTIDRHHLDEWEPALALDGLQVAYQVFVQAQRERAEALLARIVKLDMGAAVKLAAS